MLIPGHAFPQSATNFISPHNQSFTSKDDLLKAALLGFETKVKSLITNGADVNETDEYGNSALILAAERGHLNIVKILLDCSANTKQVNKNGCNALLQAVAHGHVDVALLLLTKGSWSQEDLNQRDMEEGRAVLHFAVIKAFDELLIPFVDRGANISQRDKKGQSALHYAAFKGNPLFATLLLQLGAQVNDQDENGCSPLMVAALCGHLQMVEKLLDAGANPLLQDLMGNSLKKYASNAPNPREVLSTICAWCTKNLSAHHPLNSPQAWG
eukprot:TRINITY_DN1684_c0_g1_i2.p1 TRINITY_DN1684_c0_g1~~TRINITY_DN1684_c0_g1_i2.p1  ORF type:complete len:270 (+),score=47.74 TRINITY_DN1684_c0_g1_i2:1338-2147(+)